VKIKQVESNKVDRLYLLYLVVLTTNSTDDSEPSYRGSDSLASTQTDRQTDRQTAGSTDGHAERLISIYAKQEQANITDN